MKFVQHLTSNSSVKGTVMLHALRPPMKVRKHLLKHRRRVSNIYGTAY